MSVHSWFGWLSDRGVNIASKFACESGPMGFYPVGARFWDFTVFVKRSVAESPKLQNDPNLLSEELDLLDMQFSRSLFVYCPVRGGAGVKSAPRSDPF